MKHPSEYATVPFTGMHVMVVDAGTVITDERTGEEITVNDSTVASNGAVIYCTQVVFEALKHAVSNSED